jgi:hypothetical protein
VPSHPVWPDWANFRTMDLANGRLLTLGRFLKITEKAPFRDWWRGARSWPKSCPGAKRPTIFALLISEVWITY